MTVETAVPHSDDRPLLLLISAGLQSYREYLFVSMATQYRIHLINTVEPTWERPFIVGHSVLPDLRTEDAVAEVRRLAAIEPVAGVMSWDESKIIQTAYAARELGLPGGTPEAVIRCRDKFATREVLAAAGIPQPEFALVGDLDAALMAAKKIGYPVVLKPRAASASYGVVRVDNDAELATYFDYSRATTVPHMPRFDQEVLVEEYLVDLEISVDAVVHSGQVTPLFLARKEIGFAPYFEETGHYVSHVDPLLRDPEIVRVLEQTHAALGFTDGWTHTEIKVTDDDPKVIEVNGRLGGDLIPYVGLRVSGIDPGLAAAAVAVGRKPAVAPKRDFVGGVRFCYTDQDLAVIESVTFDEAALPAAVDLAVPLAKAGDTVSRPPKGIVSGRVAFVTAVAESPQDCRAALDAAQAALRVRIR
jgi:predicted ATP-grasp superfamily ATP-dependent carboligase